MLARQQIERGEVLLGVLQERADLRRDRGQALQDMSGAVAGVGGVLGVEHLSEGGGDQAALVAAAVGEHVSDEVHGAALPA